MLPPEISYLTGIHFGAGRVDALPALLAQHGISRPLLVTDTGLVDCGLADRILPDPAATFHAVSANPAVEDVQAGLAVYREYACDGIVAAGGGSPLDCGKAIAVLVTHPEPLEQYALLRGGLGRITADKPPVVAVPTTAGTGSEVGRGALICFGRGCKLALISEHLYPTAVVCDPELTTGLPPALTAGTGMDAISHCVETFCSPKFNPVADAIALDGLGRACRNLRTAVNEGDNLAARTEMMIAALEGGLTFQKGLGLIHSLSHPLGAVPELPLHHGTLNAIFLPHVLRFNLPECPKKMDRMASAVGIARGENLPEYFSRLIQEIGLPTRLRNLHVDRGLFVELAEAALADHSTATNPRTVSAADCLEQYETAW